MFLLPFIGVLACAMLYVIFYSYIFPGKMFGLGDNWQIQNVWTFIKGILFLFMPVVFLIVGVVLLLRNAGNFFKAFYKPPADLKITKTIRERVLGVPPLPAMLRWFIHYPFVVINIKDVAAGTDMADDKFVLAKHPAHWLGGPYLLVLLDGTGAYLQRGNRFSRALGPGIYFQERFETLQELVDLRKQTMRSGKKDAPYPIQGRTKDGIKIKFNLEISFHILRPKPEENGDRNISNVSKILAENTAAEIEAEDLVMIGTPVDAGDPEAIRKAVERTALRCRTSQDGSLEYSESRWQDGIWGTVSGYLANYITKHYLDELLVFESKNRNNIPAHYVRTASGLEAGEEIAALSTGQLLSGQERERIRGRLDDDLRKSTGVRLTDLRILDFDVPPDVHEQRSRFLSVDVLSRVKEMEGKSAAEQVRIREKARARAQKELIRSVADSLGKVDVENYTEAILLSLSDILSQGLEDPTLSTFFANDTFDTLKQLREYLTGKEEPQDDSLAQG